MSAPVTIPNRPAGGSARSIAQIIANFDAILNELNGNIDNSHVKPSAAIALSKLAQGTSGQFPLSSGSNIWTPRSMSGDATMDNLGVVTLANPMWAVYRQLGSWWGMLPNDAVADTYLLMGSSVLAARQPVSFSPIGPYPPMLYRWDASEHAVAGKTTKMNIRSTISTNATPSGLTLTFRLYPITLTGAADTLTFTVGTAVPGSSVVHTTPGGNIHDNQTSGDFDVPGNSSYLIAVGTNATLANNSAVHCSAQLRVRNT